MNTPVVRPQVTAFVTAVRAQLDDLGVDEVEELTDGLEADLNDALAEAGTSPAEQFGDPVAYAAELRSAAGLPPRAVPGGRPGAVARWHERALAAVEGVRADHRWPPVRDFLVTLRPVWWVARALVAAGALAVLFGGLLVPIALVAVVVSVQLGRRRFAERSTAWRVLILAGNAVAVLGILVMSGRAPYLLEGGPDVQVVAETPPSTGVWADGQEVHNLFPFDAQGRPLSGVQLYDENGRPVAIGDSARSGSASTTETGDGDVVTVWQTPVPAVDVSGQTRWNVYPLRQRQDVESGAGTQGVGTPSPAPLPTVSPGALLAPAGTPAAVPSATPTGSPRASASVSASGTGVLGTGAPGTSVSGAPGGSAAPTGTQAPSSGAR